MNLEPFPEQPQEEHLCTVRVSTSVWASPRGLHAKKSLMFLRRQCKGVNLLEEDTSATTPLEALQRITNWNEVADGIYTVRICNEYRNWESGHIEDWNYLLMPEEAP